MKPKWGIDGYGEFQHLSVAKLPDNTLIVVSRIGDVITQDNSFDDNVKPNLLNEYCIDILQSCPIRKVRNISGKAYVAARWRTVFRRNSSDIWVCLSGNSSKQIKTLKKEKYDPGFNDIGGFSENDIYACGGQGDLWHFNGEEWSQLNCTTHLKLYSLCCAPNGKVYIGCESGRIISGRDSSWKMLDVKAPKVKIFDVVWYKDKLYLACGKYGLYVYNMDVIIPVDYLSSSKASTAENDFTPPASVRSLSADDDTLAVTGTDKVLTFNGESWKNVIYNSQY